MSHSLLKLYSAIFSTILVFGCSGGDSGGEDGSVSGLAESGVSFGGATTIEPLDSGSWQLNWLAPVGAPPTIEYHVFQKDGSVFNFTSPVERTNRSYYVTGDLRMVGNTCYVVRWYDTSLKQYDSNQNEVCTNHDPYSFDGIDALVSLRDGSYMLRWQKPPFEGAKFKILARKPSEEGGEVIKDFAETKNNFYKTNVLSLDSTVCFGVRYEVSGFPEDTNTKELCTASEGDFTFDGLVDLSSPAQGTIKLDWTASTREDVAGYRIYIGTKFKELVAQVDGRDVQSYEVNDLLHAVVYAFGVRAVDIYGREDSNEVVRSFELQNHIPVTSSLGLAVRDTDANGRPTTMTCNAQYSDFDEWQTLTPTFEFKTNKRDDLGLVERTVVEGQPGQLKAEYILIEDDNRGDEIICYVTIDDGFDKSAVVASDAYEIPDTPVIANGFDIEVLMNSESDIVITKGPDQGYTDADQDEAVEIIYTVTNGSIVSDPAVFTCIEGSCLARFKPDIDFFTDLNEANPSYATIDYQVRAGDSVSNTGTVRIFVKPVPRAISFSMNVKQDEEEDVSIGLAPELDGDGEPSVYTGYLHPGNEVGVYPHKASRMLVRLSDPFVEDEYRGVVMLPPGAPAGAVCTPVDLTGVNPTLPDGMECDLPCDANGACPFRFLSHLNMYGMSTFEFSVVVDGIVSNYATARVNILPSLRATDYGALSLEGRTFRIKFTEGLGYEGSGDGTTVDSITVSELVGADGASLNFVQTTSDPDYGSGVEVWYADVTTPGGAAGNVTFKYIVNATGPAPTFLPLESNEGSAAVMFYPKPIATGINVQSLENEQFSAPIVNASGPSDEQGFYHALGLLGQVVVVDTLDTTRGQLVDLGDGIAAGDLNCLPGGLCSQDYLPPLDYWDLSSASHRKFNYKVRVQMDPDLINDYNSGQYSVVDKFLTDDPNNQILESVTSAEAKINVRPKPVVNNLTLFMRERTNDTMSQLTVQLDSGAQYTHPLTYKAKAAQLTGPNPTQGVLDVFSCLPSGANEGRCTSDYTPAVNQIGPLTPSLQYSVTINDSQYLPNGGNIDSLPGTIDIDVRPVPKPVDHSLWMAENTTFIPSFIDISLEPNDEYTHAYLEEAIDFTVTELDVGGSTHGALVDDTCTNGVCKTRYTPNVDYVGDAEFEFDVTTNDVHLGNLVSEKGAIALDIRPRPRSNDVGTGVAPLIVVENTPTPVTLEIGDEYTHVLGLNATSVEVLSSTNHDTSNSPVGSYPCNASSGDCVFTFHPAPDFEGEAIVTYKVWATDPVAGLLESNVSTITIDVYPKPRNDGSKIFVAQLTQKTVTIDLRPEVEAALDETGDAIIDRSGYAHRRDDPAVSVAVTTPLSQGSFVESDFTCDGAGLCTITYDAPAFVQGNNDVTFSYKVAIDKKNPIDNQNIEAALAGQYEIEIKPSAFSYDFGAITLENQEVPISISKLPFGTGSGNGYEHPLDEDATNFAITEVNEGGVTLPDGTPMVVGNKYPCTSGVCDFKFVPNTNFYTPDGEPERANVKYVVYTDDPDLGQELPSNTSQVSINVRPIPRATNRNFIAVEGDIVNLVIEKDDGYTYPVGTGFVDNVNLVVASEQNGAVTAFANCSTDDGSCTGATFTPVAMGDYFYYGNLATVRYTVSLFDSDWGGTIESEEATITIDYRPRPKAATRTLKMWQGDDIDLEIAHTLGYEHPLFDGSAGTSAFKPSWVTIVSPFANGLLAPAEFDCTGLSCTTNFTPDPAYHYTVAGGTLDLTFRVNVDDPVIGETVASPPGQDKMIQLDVRPLPVNTGKTVYGVQSVDHDIVIDVDDGYLYPLSLPSAPTVVIVGAPTNGTITSAVSCQADGRCTGVFQPTNANFYGTASFDYYLTLNDPSIGETRSTETKTYEIDFFPRPVAQNFAKVQAKEFKGWEGEAITINLIPGEFPSLGLCDSANHSSYGVAAGYAHRDCEDAVEIIVDSGSVNYLAADPVFTCNSSVCTATVTPQAPGGGWLGYGVGSFQYQVRIDPTILQGVGLSTAEIDALTSDLAVLDIDFRPIPKAGGITLEDQNAAKDYIYGVQGEPLPIEIAKCATPTLVEDCHLGYVYGGTLQPEGAVIETIGSNNGNITSINPVTCIGETCYSGLSFPPSYFSDPTTSNFATFEYNVTIDGRASNNAVVKVNVYPKPVAAGDLASYQIEGNDVDLVIEKGTGYTHPVAGSVATEIIITSAADIGTVGGFVDPANTSNILSPDDLNQAFDCDASGRCTATFRPNPNTGFDKSFGFAVKVNAPNEMTEAQKGTVLSTPKPYQVKVFSKPESTGLEYVVIDGQNHSFTVSLNNGYTHDLNLTAKDLTFLNADEDSGWMNVNASTMGGRLDGTSITCLAGECTFNNCSSGNCNLLFASNPGVFSNTDTDCSVGGAACPTVQYNTTIEINEGGVNLVATSDTPGDLEFNVRQRPEVNAAAVEIIAEEGESIGLSLQNGPTTGYVHGRYDASAINKISTVHGDISADFDCTTVAGDCTATFVPDGGFVPTTADNKAVLTYKVEVTDPTPGLPQIAGVSVGDKIISASSNMIEIEYRPKPVVSNLGFASIQDQSKTVTISLNAGYAHEYNLDASKIHILADSQTNLSVNTCGGGECTIACTDGDCDVTISPDALFYGDAYFDFELSVLDTAFTPDRELRSRNTARVTFDVRPLPVAQNIEFVAVGDNPKAFSLSRGAATGYEHPYSYSAKAVTPGAPPSGVLTQAFTCDGGGICSAEYTAPNGFFGDVPISYTVTTYDPVLSQDLVSMPATITMNVRPIPVATGFNGDWVIFENDSKDLEINLGTLAEKFGYYYPTGGEYDIHPDAINVVTPPDSGVGSFASAFTCSSGLDPKGCKATFNPVLGVYGTTAFSYNLDIQDAELLQIVTSNDAAIDIDVRPIIYGDHVTYVTNYRFKAIEGEQLDWKMLNGPTLGFEYPTDAAYADILNNHIDIDVRNPVSGTLVPGHNCSAGECTGSFMPGAGVTGPASFEYNYTIEDDTLPSGEQTYTTGYFNATIDVYPLPDVSNVTRYIVQDENTSFSIDRGAGYDHDRSHNATKVNVTSSVRGGSALSHSDFSCSLGKCDAVFSPTPGASSDMEGYASQFFFDFSVDVTEPGANARTATSDSTARVGFVVYPKAVHSAANLQNVPLWAGEANDIMVARGAGDGYTHKWSHEAKGLEVTAISAGSSLNGSPTCTAGTCTISFTPALGTYGLGAANLDYRVRTEYAQLDAPNVWTASTQNILINVRPVPVVDSTELTATGVENELVTGLSVSEGSGYTYEGPVSRIEAIKLRMFNGGTHLDCDGGCAAEYSCTSGVCNLPPLSPGTDWDRTDRDSGDSPDDGMARMEYQIKVNDVQLGEKWTGWNTFAVELLPHARVGVEKLDALEKDDYTINIALNDGYTHVESALATKIEITEVTNLTNSLGETSCNGSGECSLTLSPVTGNFADVGGGKDPNNSNPYGWASFRYRVMTPVDGVDIWSPEEYGYVYFRALPLAQDISFVMQQFANEPIEIDQGVGIGYTHPEDFHAIALSRVGPAPDKGAVSSFSCETNSGQPDFKKCTASFTSPANDDFGVTSFQYVVTVNDPVLGTSITSLPATITVDIRPRPITTGLSTNLGLFENSSSIPVSIDLGTIPQQRGYYHPNSIEAQYDQHPTAINLVSSPSGAIGSFDGSFICSTSGSKGCEADFTPATNNFGTTSFDYKVTVADLELTTVTSQSTSNIVIDVRPTVKPQNLSYTTNAIFKAIENTPLNWTIQSGANQGYDYSSDVKYDGARSTITITPSGETNGSVGSSSCSSGVCSGVFNPTTNFSGAASFQYVLGWTDSAVNLESNSRVTAPATVTIDVYPKPFANDQTIYTVQGTTVPFSIARGTGAGYTHGRGDDAVAIDVIGVTSGSSIDGSDFTCVSGTCSASFTPNIGFFTTTEGDATQAFVNFKATVREDDADPRQTNSKNVGKVGVVVYPRAVADASGIQNSFSVWEGESEEITISPGSGYTHPWSHLATDITIDAFSSGSAEDGADVFECGAGGICSGSVTVPVGTYGPNAAFFTYRVQTEYANLATPQVWSNPAETLNLNVRPVPTTPSGVTVAWPEDLNTSSLSLNVTDGYEYGGDPANISHLEMRLFGGTGDRLTCDGGCSVTTCNTAVDGECPLPVIVPEADWNRSFGTSRLEYRVKATDPVKGAKWSDWQTFSLDLIPEGVGDNKEVTDGIQAGTYNGFTIDLNDGYSHAEGALATEIEVLTVKNLNVAAIKKYPCVSGVCSMDFDPVATSFVDVAGKDPNNSETYGWAEFTFKVKHQIEGFDIWSSEGKGLIYFQPAPYASDIVWMGPTPPYGIEAETLDVIIRRNGTGSCTDNCGYAHDAGLDAESITVFDATADVVGTPYCDNDGVCTVQFKSNTPGTFSFKYRITDLNGVEQASPSNATILFVERPRNNGISGLVVTEGNTIDVTLTKGTEYTTENNQNVVDVLVSNIAKGTVQQVVGGSAAACAPEAGKLKCACDGIACVIRFTPEAWDPGEGVKTGSFKYQVRDSVWKEANGTNPLAAMASSNVSITMNPRLVANSRNFPEGPNEGVQGNTLTVPIQIGSGGTSIGGYTHTLGGQADKIRIESITDLSVVGCGSVPCELTCSSGQCDVQVNALGGASFRKNASFTYNMLETGPPGFQSHIEGSSDIYFYPRVKPNGQQIIVAADEVTELTISPGAANGYVHEEGDKASYWSGNNISSANGTFDSWSCAATGVCKVNFTPTASYYSPSSNSGDFSSFTYNVVTNAASGTVQSLTPGLFEYEVFPRPVATNVTKDWVENVGNITASAGQGFKIRLKRGTAFTHVRSENPYKVIVSNASGGVFSASSPNEFSCSDDTCTAEFIPNAVSPNSSTPAVGFDYKVVVGGAEYEPFASNTARVDIKVMPKPTSTGPSITIAQDTNPTTVRFKSSENLSATPVEFDMFDHDWGLGPYSMSIDSQPTSGTLSYVTCTGVYCEFTYTPNDASFTGDVPFAYQVRVQDGSNPTKFDAWSSVINGTLTIASAFEVTGTDSVFYAYNADPIANPKTTVPLTISRATFGDGGANVGYVNVRDENAGELEILGVYDPVRGSSSSLNLSTQGELKNISMTNGTWTADFESADLFFGDLFIEYQVCLPNCTDPQAQKSVRETDMTKWIRITVELNDAPPIPCTKNLVVYRNITKNFPILKRDPAQSTCANGVWFDDANDEDGIVAVELTTEPDPASGTLQAGTGTSCDGATPRVCSCPSGDCNIEFVPASGSLVDTSFTYKITTHSELLGIDTTSQVAYTANVDVVSQLVPVAENITLNIDEDETYPLTFSPGEGYQTVSEIDGLLAEGPDGYTMLASNIIIDAYDTDKFEGVSLAPCEDDGSCVLTIDPKKDQNGTGTITYRVTANNQNSTPKTITVNMAAVNDKPNTYNNGDSSRQFERRQTFSAPGGWNISEGAFYYSGSGHPVDIVLKRWNGHPELDAPSDRTKHVYGYFDVEGQNAVKVIVDPASVVGGTITYHVDENDAFECVAGTCTASFTPDGTKMGTKVSQRARFNYRICTNTDCTGNHVQDNWSLYEIDVFGKPGQPANKHLPDETQENPDHTATTWDPAYVVARDNYVDLLVSRSNQYTLERWRNYPGTEYATGIEFGNGSNGADAPTKGSIVPESSSCNAVGTCVIRFQALDFYDNYPEVATFWYRLVRGQGYDYHGYPWADHLERTSAWKKVTLRVDLNSGVGCDDAPSFGTFGNKILAYELPQGQSYNFTLGNGSSEGNHYLHSGVGANWRPLDDLDIDVETNGTITNLDCTTQPGKCTGTIVPTGADTSLDMNDDFAGISTWFDIAPIDDWGCQGSHRRFHVNVKPYISTRDICNFDFSTDRTCFQDDYVSVVDGDDLTISFRKRGALDLEAYGQYEYETIDNADATKIELFNFNTDALSANPLQPISGAGVSCTGATYDAVVCTIEGASCVSGTCSATFSAKENISNYGDHILSFDYKVYVGNTVSKGVWQRNYFEYWPHREENWNEERDAVYKIYVKEKPVVTNPSFEANVNEDIVLIIGEENEFPAYKGYTYADGDRFADRSMSASVFAPVNGQVIDIAFDSTEKKATITFRPDEDFIGTAQLGYRVNFWDALSEDGLLTVNVSSNLMANDIMVSGTENVAETINVNLASEYTQIAPHTFKASAITVFDVNPLHGVVSGETCDEVTGACSFVFTPETNFVGTATFKYKLESGGAGDKTFSNNAEVTVDVINAPAKPVVYAMNFTGKDNEGKLIAISRAADTVDGPTSGYYDINEDDATSLEIISVTGGTLSPSDASIACTDGLCLVTFTRDSGQYGNASFDFNVTAGGETADSNETITVDFEPVLTATGGIELNGVKNQAKQVTVSLGSGYEFNPGANVESLVITSITNAASPAQDDVIDCTTGTPGECSFAVTPVTDFFGDVTFTYKVRVDTANPVITESDDSPSNVIHIAENDQAPVATDFTVNLPDHSAIVIDIRKGTEYTDFEGDNASAFTVEGTPVGGTVSAESCTDGDCQFTFTPTPGYQGEAVVEYKVTANAADSNIAKISIEVPPISSLDFDIAWAVDDPTLNSQCMLEVPGELNKTGVETCGGLACSTNEGQFTAAVSTLGPFTGDENGFSGQINVFDNPGQFYSTWTVTDTGANSITAGRFLNLEETAPSVLRRPIVSAAASTEESMPGYQLAFDGCLGGSCSADMTGSVASGDGFSCSLQADSRVACWGTNADGRLGINSVDASNRLLPQHVKSTYTSGMSDFYGLKAVTTGAKHACALLPFGQVACWGDNDFGQIGDGNTGTDALYPKWVTTDGVSTPLANVVALSAKNNHTCAVTSSGEVHCWGQNSNGQLGDGSTTDRDYAAPVLKVTSKTGATVNTTANLTDVFSVSAGQSHTCAVTTARNALCWGSNAFRQVGDNDYWSFTESEMSKVDTAESATGDRPYPVHVRNEDNSLVGNIVSVKAGYESSCLVRGDGALKCWGLNDHGQTGAVSSATNPVVVPTIVQGVAGAGQLDTAVGVSMGDGFACAHTEDMGVACFGDNSSNQFGDGTSVSNDVPQAVQSSGADLDAVIALSVGINHSCALTSDGYVKCFGSNASGELGMNSLSGYTEATDGALVNSSGTKAIYTRQVCGKVYTVTTSP